MSIEDRIIKFLKSYKNNIISLNKLENILSGEESYSEFASVMEDLIENKILNPVKDHGTNGKIIPLYNTYRIIRRSLRESINNEIQRNSIEFNSNINLDIYFSLKEEEWEKDLQYIKIIDDYLLKNDLPADYVTSSERSFQIVGDEKWIDEEDGKKILERIKLWEKLKIITNPDPLMVAINPSKFIELSHIHLVVENKTTFYNLVDSINKSEFTSLIYGAGWKITANIHRLYSQLGLENNLHKIYYFGDMDAEGISIWYSIYEKHNIELALPFYKAMLNKSYSVGKANQQRNEKAIEKFEEYFLEEEKAKISKLVENGGYLPQEALRKEELESIWRNEIWEFP